MAAWPSEFSFEWVKCSFTTFGPPWYNLFGYSWKSSLLPPLEKIFPTPIDGSGESNDMNDVPC